MNVRVCEYTGTCVHLCRRIRKGLVGASNVERMLRCRA